MFLFIIVASLHTTVLVYWWLNMDCCRILHHLCYHHCGCDNHDYHSNHQEEMINWWCEETMIPNKTTTDTNNPHYVIFVSFSNHSLSFISHYSTIFYYHLFIPIQYYWIQSREYHSHHSLLISFISYFHSYLHSHIISILFISHNSSTSLSHSVPITSICYYFINSHPFISSSLIISCYDCCWL